MVKMARNKDRIKSEDLPVATNEALFQIKCKDPPETFVLQAKSE